MPAAQCNKLASDSPSPLQDVGNDFQRLKGESQPSPGQRSVVSFNSSQLQSRQDITYQFPATSSACGAPGSHGGENIIHVLPPPQGDTQGTLISVVDTISYLGAVYSQVTHFSMNAPVNAAYIASTSAGPCWEVGSLSAAAPSLAMTGTDTILPNYTKVYFQLQNCHLQDTYNSMLPGQCGVAPFGALPPPQYPSSGGTLYPLTSSPNYAEAIKLEPAEDHLLKNYNSDYPHLQHLYVQENHKSMLPGKSDVVSCYSLTGPPPQLPSPRSQRRNSGRTTCDCPNCAEAEKLCPPGVYRRKKNIHNCHIPGCGKVYEVVSRLRRHLRWHKRVRSLVCNRQFCGKRFTRSDNLKRHLRTHTVEKLFACHVCSKRFMRSDHLSSHVKTHNGNGEGNKNVSSSASSSDSENSQLEQTPLGSLSPQGQGADVGEE